MKYTWIRNRCCHCYRFDSFAHFLSSLCGLPRTHSQDHSAHAHSRKSLSLTHTYTENITFTHSHRHTLMLMHKHTLMLLLIQTHTCSTQSPSTPAEKSMCISSITALTDGPGSLLPSPSLLSLLSFPFFVQIQDVKMFTLRCRHSDELIAVFDSRTEHGGEKTHT